MINWFSNSDDHRFEMDQMDQWEKWREQDLANPYHLLTNFEDSRRYVFMKAIDIYRRKYGVDTIFICSEASDVTGRILPNHSALYCPHDIGDLSAFWEIHNKLRDGKCWEISIPKPITFYAYRINEQANMRMLKTCAAPSKTSHISFRA